MWAEIGASVFLGSYRVFRFVHGAAKSLFEGFWMGLLPERSWDIISERSYGAGENYTRTAWLDSGLQFWEDLAVRRFFHPEAANGMRIWVAAAGGGREMIALSRMGFSVDGFDCSRSMVAAGVAALSERRIAGNMEWAPPCQSLATSENYSAVIVGWNGYTYIAPRDRRFASARFGNRCSRLGYIRMASTRGVYTRTTGGGDARSRVRASGVLSMGRFWRCRVRGGVA